MKKGLAKSALSIQKALDEFQLKCQVLELPTSTRTADDAAASIGCNVNQIVKSLIFKTKKTIRPVLILVSGVNRVDMNQISHLIGEQIEKANADFARNITGFAIGGIPPIGHKQEIELIYIDQDLMELEEVWAAAGTPNAVFSISSKDLANITKGNITKMS